ncbi:lyase family protein, partial [Escherichia coli]|uniref:lyase family protein n=1 Tax=Escherichia coli TaxID=562 RepID=UPI00211A224B
ETTDGKTLWHGRFAGGPAEALMAYTVSLPLDQQMWPDDIAGSRAHVRGLARVGLLTDEERDSILAALDDVAREMGSGTFVHADSDEDIHTA